MDGRLMVGLDNDQLRSMLMTGLAAEDDDVFGAALCELLRRSPAGFKIWFPDGRGVEVRPQ